MRVQLKTSISYPCILGEFSAGNQKMRNEEQPKTPTKKVDAKKTLSVLAARRQSLKRKYGSSATLMPKTVPLPYCHDNDILEYRVSIESNCSGRQKFCQKLKFLAGNLKFGVTSKFLMENSNFRRETLLCLFFQKNFQPQSVACGTEHVLVLTADGSIFSWGTNRFGQCGVGHSKPVHTPTVRNVLVLCKKN